MMRAELKAEIVKRYLESSRFRPSDGAPGVASFQNYQWPHSSFSDQKKKFEQALGQDLVQRAFDEEDKHESDGVATTDT